MVIKHLDQRHVPEGRGEFVAGSGRKSRKNSRSKEEITPLWQPLGTEWGGLHESLSFEHLVPSQLASLFGGGLGGVALLQEVHHCGPGFEIKPLASFIVLFHFACGLGCEL